MRRQRRAPHPRRRRCDAGNLNALEAVFIFMLFFTTITLLPSMDPPRTSSTPMREHLETQLEDLLFAFESMPSQDAFQRIADRIVAKGHQGNDTEFRANIERFFPPGTECGLHLDNGKTTRLLVGEERPHGVESVSASRLWRPTWAYTFALPGLQVVGNHTPLTVQGYQVSQGSLVKPQGVPIDVTLRTNQGNYSAGAVVGISHASSASIHALDSNDALTWVTQTLQGFIPTRVLSVNLTAAPEPSLSFTVPDGSAILTNAATSGGPSSAVTLNFRDPNGVLHPMTLGSSHDSQTINNPIAGTWTLNTTGTYRPGFWVNLSSTATPDSLWRNLTLAIRNTADAPMPQGTRLRVELPAGSGVLAMPTVNPQWRHVQRQGDNLTAELNQDVATEARFTLGLQYVSLYTDALFLAKASLSNGTVGASNLVLDRFNNPSTITWPHSILAHRPYVNAPRAASPGHAAPWSVLLPYPMLFDGPLEEAKQLDLVARDGQAMFGALSNLQPATGWELVSPSHVRWTGNKDLVSNAVLQFGFDSVVPDQVTEVEPWQGLPVSFANGDEFRIRDMQEPYVFRGEVPPVYRYGGIQAGYEWPPGTAGSNPVNRSWGSAEVQRGLLVRGNATYGATEFTALTDVTQALRWGYQQGSVSVSKKQVRIGESVDVTVNFTGLYEQVQLLDQNVTLNVTWLNTSVMVFDPAQPFVSFGEMVPSFKGTWGPPLNVSTNPPSVRGLAPWTMQKAGSAVSVPGQAVIQLAPPFGALYGPYPIVVEFYIVIENLAAPPGTLPELKQFARIVTIVDLVPDSGQSETALYWLSLECWLPDW